MGDRFPLLAIAGLLLFGSLGAFLVRGAARSDYADALSTYRAGPRGARALYLLAEEVGIPVRRHQNDLEIAPGGEALVVLGADVQGAQLLSESDAGKDKKKEAAEEDGDSEDLPRARRLNFFAPRLEDDEVQKLLEHVQKGKTLIYVPWDVRDDAILRAVGMSLRPADRKAGMRTLVPAQPSRQTLGVERVEAPVQAWIDFSEHAVPLLVDAQQGEAAAAIARHGKGAIVVLSAPDLATNAALSRADNARLWVSLLRAAAGKGAVAFDEFHHGFTDDRSISQFALRYRLHLAVGPLLFGLCFWAAALRRFGRPRPPKVDEREGGLDALLATSRLYREGHHHRYAAQQIAQGLAMELAPAAGIHSRSTPDQVAAALGACGLKELAGPMKEVAALAEQADKDRGVERVALAAARARITARRRRKSAPAPLRAERTMRS